MPPQTGACPPLWQPARRSSPPAPPAGRAAASRAGGTGSGQRAGHGPPSAPIGPCPGRCWRPRRQRLPACRPAGQGKMVGWCWGMGGVRVSGWVGGGVASASTGTEWTSGMLAHATAALWSRSHESTPAAGWPHGQGCRKEPTLARMRRGFWYRSNSARETSSSMPSPLRPAQFRMSVAWYVCVCEWGVGGGGGGGG